MIDPNSATLKAWAASLIIDFPQDNIPSLIDEKNWKVFGNLLIQEPSFSSNAAPSTNGFSDAKSWMRAVYKQMVNF